MNFKLDGSIEQPECL